MHELRKFLKSTGIYLVGNILTKAAQFLMLPLYTRYLNPDDYGTFDLHIAYITFLSSILFLDIWGGILRFMFDYKMDEEKAGPVANGMLIFTGSTFLYSLFVFIVGNALEISYLGWLYLYGITMNLAQVIGYVARGFGKNFIYAVGGLCGTVTNLLCNIVFIAFMDKGYEYLYISYCIGMVINIVIVASNIHFGNLVKRSLFSKKLFHEMFRFAAPLSLNSAAYWFLTSYNKVVINQQLSAVENGLYAVAVKFSAMIQLVTQCFQMAWQELTFSKAGLSKGEMSNFYTKAVNEYIKFMGLGTILLIPVIKIIFPIMIDPAYHEAENIIPITLLGALFSCISSFVASIISTLKKNRMIFTTTLLGSIVNVLLVHILIGKIGVQAASISFAMGYLIVVIRRMILVNQYLDVRVDKRNILMLFTGFCIVNLVYIHGQIGTNLCLLLGLFFIGIYGYRNILLRLVRR